MNKSEYENLSNEPLVINGFFKYLIANALFCLFCVVLPIGVGSVGVMSVIMVAAEYIKGEFTFLEAFSSGTVIIFLCAISFSLLWRNPGKLRFVINDETVEKGQ